jgi:hypothetical protein
MVKRGDHLFMVTSDYFCSDFSVTLWPDSLFQHPAKSSLLQQDR